MKKIFFVFLYLGLLCGDIHAQEVKKINAEELAAFIHHTTDTVYVLNFWATWCKPCIEEMPVFEKAFDTYKGELVKIILISNDFSKQINTKLKPFILQIGLKNEVWWMNETDPNRWVNKVNLDWEGELPATLVLGGGKRSTQFHAGELNDVELKVMIEKQK